MKWLAVDIAIIITSQTMMVMPVGLIEEGLAESKLFMRVNNFPVYSCVERCFRHGRNM